MANQIAHGFINMQTVFDQRVVTQNVEDIRTAIDVSVEEHNRQLESLNGLFVEPTNDFQVWFRTPGVSRSQPLDEQGRARKIAAVNRYQVAFPIQSSGSAWGQTYKSVVKMLVGEANDATVTLTMGDARWIRDHILAAVFYNGSGWVHPDDEHGNLTIMGPANGDTQTYQIATGADAGVTAHQHFVAQAAAISDAADPFPAMYTNLFEHPENAGEGVAFIPTNLKGNVEALEGFVPVSNTRLRAAASQREIVGELGVAVPGRIIGYHDAGMWIVEWRSLVSNYIIGVCTEGARALRMREEPEPELQGFRKVAERNDHPFFESQYQRHAGFGSYNRVGVVVQLIGSGTYAIPTGYESPMV